MRETVYIGRSRRLPMLRCPNCNGDADGATSFSASDENPTPRPGDMSLCIHCARWLIFEESIASTTPVRLRLATRAEIDSLRRCNPVADIMQEVARERLGQPKPRG